MVKRLLPVITALALAITLHAQLTPLQDPANLAGERVSPQDPADTLPLNHGAPALQQLLAKLRTRASLMLIVAHPDDEDGGLLTYESRGQGARVAMLTLTRGEGGQNLMSADFDDALGLIRTQELLAADRYFGVDQFFGTEVDFGFSKTKQESFEKWTHDRVLYDAVRAVRLYRPLVIASVFVGGPTDGHGHHQVAGQIAQEVFVAAADPNVFPEMIAEGLLPWAPLKVYARVPFSRVTPEGMYDYATGKTIPTRFHNYVTGEDSTAVPSATVLIHEGDKPTDPTLAAAMGGDTFLQFARKGLALQKTQIGPNARLAPAGAFDTGYTLMATRLGCIETKIGCPTFATVSPSLRWASTKPTTEQSLFDGIDTSLLGLVTLLPDAPASLRSSIGVVDGSLAEAQRLFSPTHPEAIAPPLTEAINNLDSVIGDIEKNSFSTVQKATLLHELRIKRVQCNNALINAYALNLSAAISDPRTPLLHTQHFFSVDANLANPTRVPIKALSGHLLLPVPAVSSAGVEALGLAATNTTFRIDTEVSSQLPLTRPYFYRHLIEQAFYDIADVNLRNAPSALPPFTVAIDMVVNDAPIHMVSTVMDAKNYEAATVVPPISVEFASPTHIIPSENSDFTAGVVIENETGHPIDADSGSLLTVMGSGDPPLRVNDVTLALLPAGRADAHIRLLTPSSWRVTPVQRDVLVPSPGVVVGTGFTIDTGHLRAGASFEISSKAVLFGETYTERYRKVGYIPLPRTPFYTPATYRATAVDLHTAPNLHIAYLPGTGDPVPDFLPNLGITPTVLTLKDLTSTTLNKYDAILLGVRAYAAHPELAGPGSQPLLDYAKQGGVVILQYNTARFGDAEAPFSIDVPGDPAHNVVEEAQPVTVLHPEAPLLAWPNKITPADFDGWVAERGHGFAATWSPQFQPLLETHDVGQDPQQGGLLLARTGKGAYIYCALALYRQLPEGVPGAYRLLANLLSYARNPELPK